MIRRSIANGARFSPKRLLPAALKKEPRIQEIIDELIADMEGAPVADIIQQLAIPLPVTVIADLLGVPSRDREQIKAWSDILFLPYNLEAYTDIEQQKDRTMKEFAEYLYPIVLEKRKHRFSEIFLIREHMFGIMKKKRTA
ncbi:hypothetical protein [Paenibacillus sp. TH7-28]